MNKTLILTAALMSLVAYADQPYGQRKRLLSTISLNTNMHNNMLLKESESKVALVYDTNQKLEFKYPPKIWKSSAGTISQAPDLSISNSNKTEVDSNSSKTEEVNCYADRMYELKITIIKPELHYDLIGLSDNSINNNTVEIKTVLGTNNQNLDSAVSGNLILSDEAVTEDDPKKTADGLDIIDCSKIYDENKERAPVNNALPATRSLLAKSLTEDPSAETTKNNTFKLQIRALIKYQKIKINKQTNTAFACKSTQVEVFICCDKNTESALTCMSHGISVNNNAIQRNLLYLLNKSAEEPEVPVTSSCAQKLVVSRHTSIDVEEFRLVKTNDTTPVIKLLVTESPRPTASNTQSTTDDSDIKKIGHKSKIWTTGALKPYNRYNLFYAVEHVGSQEFDSYPICEDVILNNNNSNKATNKYIASVAMIYHKPSKYALSKEEQEAPSKYYLDVNMTGTYYSRVAKVKLDKDIQTADKNLKLYNFRITDKKIVDINRPAYLLDDAKEGEPYKTHIDKLIQSTTNPYDIFAISSNTGKLFSLKAVTGPTTIEPDFKVALNANICGPTDIKIIPSYLDRRFENYLISYHCPNINQYRGTKYLSDGIMKVSFKVDHTNPPAVSPAPTETAQSAVAGFKQLTSEELKAKIAAFKKPELDAKESTYRPVFNALHDEPIVMYSGTNYIITLTKINKPASSVAPKGESEGESASTASPETYKVYLIPGVY